MADAAVPEADQTPLLGKILCGFTKGLTRFPTVCLVLWVGLAAGAVWYTQSHLQFKTSRSDLIDPDADYQQRWLSYTRAFGDASDMVVVIEGDQAEKIRRTIDELGPRLESEPQFFRNVFYRVAPTDALRHKALQYLPPEHLFQLHMGLDELGPVLEGRWHLLSLSGMFRSLRHKLAQTQSQPPDVAAAQQQGLLNQAALLSSSMVQFSQQREPFESPWQQLVPGQLLQMAQGDQIYYLLNKKGTIGFVKAQPVVAENDFTGASKSITRLREIMADVRRKHPDIKLGLTGIPVLESDEMQSSQESMSWASVLSFLGVTVILGAGFRGLRHPLLAIAMLAIGTAWSFGFATAAVGHLNILSVSFTAMLVGLGIDFGIVYVSRYLELRHRGFDLKPALLQTAQGVGPGIWTAAVTTSVAFAMALFTNFAGVAELGIIAGGGILLCAAAAFLVLPPLLTLTDRRTAPQQLPAPLSGGWLNRIVTRNPKTVLACTLLCVGSIGYFGLRVKYDYNLLNLQAEGVESVAVQQHIFQQADDGSVLFAVSMANSQKQALELKEKFAALPTVHHVEEIASKLPLRNAESLELLQAIHAKLSNLPERIPASPDINPENVGRQVEELDKALAEIPGETAKLARQAIDQLLDRLELLPLEKQVVFLRDYHAAMSLDLHRRLSVLASLSDPEPLQLSHLPAAWASRYVSATGDKWLLQIFPKEQVWDIEPLTRFIQDVRGIDPDATGTPLQTFEASREIRQSYEQVGLYALIAVLLLLLVDFRRLTDAVLAMLPPTVGAGMMFGLLGLLQVDLNPANLIVLPLIIGIGVDGGVHVVHDFRTQHGRYRISSSTFSSLLLNSLTTMVGFGSMMIAPHRGLYSLGLVITVGVGCCLLVSTVALPAVLSIIDRFQRRGRLQARRELLPSGMSPAFSSDPVSHPLTPNLPAAAPVLSSALTASSGLTASQTTFPPRPHLLPFDPATPPSFSSWVSTPGTSSR